MHTDKRKTQLEMFIALAEIPNYYFERSESWIISVFYDLSETSITVREKIYQLSSVDFLF